MPRLRSKNPNVTGGGGAVTAPAKVTIGPDYGIASSGHIFEPQVTTVALINTMSLTHESAVSSYSLTNSVELAAEDAVDAVAQVGSWPMLTEAQVADAEHNVVEYGASKDVRVSTAELVGTCLDTANYDGADLLVSDLPIDNNASALIGFDLSGFPAGATIIGATLHLNASLVSTIAATTYILHALSSADEGWTEAAVCSNAPSTASPTQDFGQPITSGALDLTLTTAWTTYLQNRIGTAVTASFKIRDGNTPPTAVTYHDRESGSSLGPRLSLTWTA